MLSVDINNISVRSGERRTPILNEINFEIKPGNIYTILGKNGSGKSTLLKSIPSLLDKNFYSVNGKVLFNDKDLWQMNEDKLLEIRRNKIRYIPQDASASFDPLKKLSYYFKLFDLPVDKVEQELEFLSLPSYKDLEKLYAYELSGGMAQRVLLLLNILSNPTVLLLDEPTSAVDSATSSLIQLRIKKFINEYRIILLVTQDLLFAKTTSDLAAYLEDGTLSEFKMKDEFFSEFESKFNYTNLTQV